MITNRFSFLVAAIVVIYFISDYFFNDAMLYILGGLFGALTKALGAKNSIFFIWALLLIGFIVLYYYSQNKILEYFSIVLVGVLLYLFDFILYKTMPDITDLKSRYIHIGISILIKSAALLLIIYLKYKELMITKAPN